MKSPNIRYVFTVDHLRAFAASLIVFYHGMQLFGSFARTGGETFDHHHPVSKNPLIALIVEGHTAVAVFLLLSGFIFTYGSAGKNLSYRQFIANRLWRIAPMFFLVILFGIHVFPDDYNFLGLVQDLTFFGDLTGAAHAGSLTNNTWTVALEFRCYLIFPFLLSFIERYGLKYVFGILLVTFLFRWLHFLTYDRAEGIAYWTIVGRLDQFVIGMATALVYRKLEAHKRLLRWMFPVAVVIALRWVVWFNGGGGINSERWDRLFAPLIEGSVWALFVITYVAFDRGDNVKPGWISATMARLGQISFSTYLLHFPLIVVLIHRRWVPHLSADPMMNGLLTTLLVAWPLSMVISTLTYNVIERPFMGYRKRYLQGATAT